MRQTSRGRIARLRRRWEAGLGPFARVVRLDPDGRDTTLPEGEDPDAVLLGPLLDVLHPADVRDLLHQVRDRLAPGGRLILDSRRYGAHHLDELLLRHGFHVEQRVELGPGTVAYCCTVTPSD